MKLRVLSVIALTLAFCGIADAQRKPAPSRALPIISDEIPLTAFEGGNITFPSCPLSKCPDRAEKLATCDCDLAEKLVLDGSSAAFALPVRGHRRDSARRAREDRSR